MRAHAITTKASTTVSGGILALGLAVVLLAATASSASAAFFVDPGYWAGGAKPSFDFGDRQVGTTSPAERFRLRVADGEALAPTISVSGDYAQTNNCPPELRAGPGQFQDCLITVTFTPTGTGPRGGTLSTGPGGPRPPTFPTVPLTGTGVTTPTPPALPLLLSAAPPNQTLKKKVTLPTITNNDATVVATGGVKTTTKRLTGGEGTKIKAKVKHLKRLDEKPGRPKINVKLAATDEFGQTATAKIKVEFCHEVTLGECAGYYERQGVMALGAQTATSTTGERVDRVPPDLRLSGAKTQQADGPHRICDMWVCDVIVHVSCGDEECMAHARGRLTKVKYRKLEPDGGPPYGLVAPGEELRLGPEMAKDAQRKQVRKALNDGKNVRAKITVRAHDAAGNVATAKRTIRIVK